MTSRYHIRFLVACVCLTSWSCGQCKPDPAEATFRMRVEDVFFIHGRGVVVTGLIANGTVTVGDTIELVRTNGTRRAVEVKGVETFRKLLTSASAGENVGILLAGLQKEDVSHGDVLHTAKKE